MLIFPTTAHSPALHLAAMQATSSQKPSTNNSIVTPRLHIVPFGEEHLTARYVGWLNDPVVVRYSEQRHITHTLDSCRAYLRSFHDTPHCFWAILASDAADPACPEQAGKTHIGNINAYVDAANGTADVGILLGEQSAWGQGYGLEAWTAVCQYLLREQNLRKITAGTLSVNTPMLKLMQRAGMTPDGTRRQQIMFEGEPVDVVYAALFRTDFSYKLIQSSMPRSFIAQQTQAEAEWNCKLIQTAAQAAART